MTLTDSPIAELLSDQIAELADIDLDALTRRAALQTRVDRKYVLHTAELLAGLARVADDMKILEIDDLRKFEYHSMYFDTPNLDCFRDHRQGRRRRFKVRTRHYLDSGECMLEVKAPDARGRTVKNRVEYAVGDRLTDAGWAFVRAALPAEPAVGALRPSLATDYRRITLLDAPVGGRVTIDTDLRFVIPDDAVGASGTPAGTSDSSTGCTTRTLSCPSDVVIVETKTANGIGTMDRALRRLGIQPVSISKYCIGTAMAHPNLAANRWHRVLKRLLVTQSLPNSRPGAPQAISKAPSAQATFSPPVGV